MVKLKLLKEQKPNVYIIFRFMIDYRYQRKGIGRLALLKVIEEIRQIENAQKVIINWLLTMTRTMTSPNSFTKTSGLLKSG